MGECLCDLQVEKDDEDGQDECLEYEHGEGVAQHFAQEYRTRVRGCEAQAHQAVVLFFDSKRSAEAQQSCKSRGDPKDAGGYCFYDWRAGFIYKIEDDDDQKCEEGHGTEAFSGAPFGFEIFLENGEGLCEEKRHFLAGGFVFVQGLQFGFTEVFCRCFVY